MNKLLLTVCISAINCAAFAQHLPKDSVIRHIPVVNNKIVYIDTVSVKGHTAMQLDSAAKKWFLSYFIHPDSITNTAPLAGNNAVLNRGIFDFKCMPGYIN